MNLAPTEAVELYVVRQYIPHPCDPLSTATQIIEELEDRLGDQMEDILDTVKGSLHDRAAPINRTADGALSTQGEQANAVVYSEYQEDYPADGQWDYDANEVVFDDSGEGVGIEGDLDVEDD